MYNFKTIKAGSSIGSILDRTRGIGQGFNFLRIALSLAVIFVHSYQTAYGFGIKSKWLSAGPLGPVVAATLIMFFALSGFLITGSAIRTGNLRTFVSFRLLRLVPALFVEIVLSAFFLGIAFTTMPWQQYFGSRQFYLYFGNIVGWIHYTLPGVFHDNPVPEIVNRSLWTLHPELECYAIMSILILTSFIKNRRLLTVGWAISVVSLTAIDFFTTKLHLQGNFPGPVLVFYFLSGIVGFHWRYRVPSSRGLFIAACVSAYLLLNLAHTGFICSIPIVYIMMYVGVTVFPKWSIIERGDYSYGMYLYGYPIQQMIVHLLPNYREWWVVFPLAVIVSYAVAALSWHIVEKPALKLKKLLGGKVMQAAAPVQVAHESVAPQSAINHFETSIRPN